MSTNWAGERAEWDPAKYRLDVSTIRVPARIELDESQERLIWTWPGKPRGQVKPPHAPREKLTMLHEFQELADAPAEGIRDYARRWGVLSICDHGLPSTHNARSSTSWERPAGMEYCYPKRYPLDDPTPAYWISDGWFQEPVDRWRHYAREAGAILRLAPFLWAGKLGDASDWEVFSPGHEAWRQRYGLPIKEERRLLSWRVSQWLEWGGVKPFFLWQGVEAPHLQLEPRGLFGLLAMHLALAVSQVEGFAVCSECGNPYIPRRKPRDDQRNYCPTCQALGAPARYASSNYHKRRRGRADPTAERKTLT